MVQKRIDFFKSHYNIDEPDDPQLLQTIKVPKNMLFLTEKLPKPNYEKIPTKKNLSFSNNEADMVRKKKQIKKNIEKELKAENINDSSYLHNDIVIKKETTSKDIEALQGLIEKPKKNNHSVDDKRLPNIEHKYILPAINSNENRNYINKIEINEGSNIK